MHQAPEHSQLKDPEFRTARHFKRRHVVAAGIAGALIAVAAVVVLLLLYSHRDSFPDIASLRESALHMLQDIPRPLYFAAFVLMPAMGFPLSFFYLTVIPVMAGSHPAIAVTLAWLAVLANMALSRWLVVGWLRPSIERFMARHNRTVPEWNRRNEWQVVLAVRLSPMPFPVQNYLLALGHARWLTYLWLSWPLQAAIGLAVMLVGQSILQGGLGYAMFAVAVFLFINIVLQRLRSNLANKNAAPQPLP